MRYQPEIDEQEKIRWRSRATHNNQSLNSLDRVLEAHDASVGGRVAGASRVKFKTMRSKE